MEKGMEMAKIGRSTTGRIHFNTHVKVGENKEICLNHSPTKVLGYHFSNNSKLLSILTHSSLSSII